MDQRLIVAWGLVALFVGICVSYYQSDRKSKELVSSICESIMFHKHSHLQTATLICYNIFVLSIVKQLGVTPDVRGVTASPAMMQLNQVSLRKVLQLKMFPGLSYLVVAASPRQGCLLERRRCWGGWVLLWVVL